MIDINVKGVFFCTRAAIGALRASAGNIVNTASVSGLIGHPDSAVYCASKGAVVNMTRAMALEFAPAVRVNCICPGAVDTDMMRQGATTDAEAKAAFAASAAEHPLKRIATAEEIAAGILYLACDDARFVTGAALAIDGGFGIGK
jgi:NAD(P)-dependent dehydrogenase (short-subunit alcohol dehydrogenase family)